MCTVMHELSELATAGPVGSRARKLMATPIEERAYGINARELLPGSEIVFVHLEQIVEQLISVNPSIIEGLSGIGAAAHQCLARAHRALVPLASSAMLRALSILCI